MVIVMLKKRASLIAAAACIAFAPLQEAHADLATAIARQAAKQASRRAADQVTRDIGSSDRKQENAEEIARRVNDVAKNTSSVMSEGGISGVIAYVSECYSASPKSLNCIYADAAVKYIDDSFTLVMGFPNTPYYDDITYNGRMTYVLKNNFDESVDVNTYHSLMFRLVSRAVDRWHQ